MSHDEKQLIIVPVIPEISAEVVQQRQKARATRRLLFMFAMLCHNQGFILGGMNNQEREKK